MRKFVLFLTLFTFFGASFAGLTTMGDKKPVNNSETLEYLTRTIGEYLPKLERPFKLEFVELQSATHQTVVGSKYEILAKLKEKDMPVNCTITMLEKPWSANYPDFDVICCKKNINGNVIETTCFSTHIDVSRHYDDFESAFGNAVLPIRDEDLSRFTSKLSYMFVRLENKYPEFNYTLKRVVSGRFGVRNTYGYGVSGKKSVLQIEVTPKDHADQIIPCEGSLYENMLTHNSKFYLLCGGKRYSSED